VSSFFGLQAEKRTHQKQKSVCLGKLFIRRAQPLIKAILFDLDDTLLDRTTSLAEFVKEHYLRYKLDHVAYDTYHRRFMELDQRGYAAKPLVFQALIADFAVPASVEILLADFQRDAWNTCILLPDAVAVLAELRLRGYKLGVITNGEDWSQMRKLRVTGLLALVDLIVISGNEQIKKPDPLIFTRAAGRLAVRPDECAFVGDHALNDIYGAGAVGMKTIWYPGDQVWPAEQALAPDYTISSLGDLLAINL
jgi:putative hydrolase of the HAD superfamily